MSIPALQYQTRDLKSDSNLKLLKAKDVKLLLIFSPSLARFTKQVSAFIVCFIFRSLFAEPTLEKAHLLQSWQSGRMR